ncbi:hypothetical protein B0O99DRAFT_525394 [Bisporella sp. PMI_857]|nr:hypothetical protein B0O99DRAFT_525394 [Bisporella sp. PMI_857]
MVNRGKPSRDCLPCRKRKLRCDLQNNGCSQCQRARLICHGYRDPNELTVRDETYSTRQKALARTTLTNPADLTSLQLGWDVQARHTFFATYIFGLSSSYDVLAPLYEQAPESGSLSASVDAVSMAFMSFQFDTQSLTHLASERYVVAIQRVGRALRSPQTSTTDETLQSILLLDLYEKIVNRNPGSSTSWMSHLRGAMSLIKARGKRNFSSYTGHRLATRLAVTLIISCGVASVRVPDAVVTLHRDLASYADHPKWAVTALVVNVVNLRADYHNGRFACLSEVAKRAKELDDLFANLERMLPPSWMPRRVFCPSYNPLLFGPYYDIYQDHFVTQLRNAIRTMRLLLNNMIWENSLGDASDPRKVAAKTIREIAGEICAAVPQFILPEARPVNQAPFSPLQRLQCYTLLAPLYIAGQLSTDYALRDWAVYTIGYIAEASRSKTAKDVACILRATPGMDYWIIYSMLGSYALAA